MKKKKSRPLALKYKLLIVLIPIIIASILAITAINASYMMSSTRNTLEKALRETVDITAKHISENIKNKVNLVKLLSKTVVQQYGNDITRSYANLLAEGSIDEFEENITSLGENYGFLSMMVIDTDGYAMTTNHSNLGDLGAEYYTEIVKGHDSYVTDVTQDKGKLNGMYVLNFSAPITNTKDQLIGVLVCKSSADELSDLVSAITVGKNGSTFIMDNNGQCIAHKDSEVLFSGTKYQEYKTPDRYPSLNKLWDSMTSQSSGYMTYNLNGTRIASFTRIADTKNWSIAVTASEAEFLQGAIDARYIMLWVGVGVIVLFAFILVLLLNYMTHSVAITAKRLERLSEGDILGEIEVDRTSEETYILSYSAAKLVDTIQVMIHETEITLTEIANGNLTVTTTIDYPGDFAVLKDAIEQNVGKLNEVIQKITRAAEEVARGSSQMASGASGLAQGASEQASSLEELFETVSTLAQRTYEIGGIDKRRVSDIDDDDENEDEDQVAIRKFDAAETLAEKLTIAINKIAETSGAIRKIASGIESISAETGMLALNASVEAIHAGEAGKGFSVIANEIRSLSEKSREAAREADNKIEKISRAITRGTQTVDLTISTIGEMIFAVSQVKSALEQISNIVENIAATAEETAAGSEELSSQAELLRNLVSEFKYHADDTSAN